MNKEVRHIYKLTTKFVYKIQKLILYEISTKACVIVWSIGKSVSNYSPTGQVSDQPSQARLSLGHCEAIQPANKSVKNEPKITRQTERATQN
jgi:hypothetical protein